MATHVARQAAARARWPAVSAGVPIPASKITAPVPAWLDQRLSLAESWAYAAAGDIQAALAAADRAGGENSPEAAVTLARAWGAAGDARNATRALTPGSVHHALQTALRARNCRPNPA